MSTYLYRGVLPKVTRNRWTLYNTGALTGPVTSTVVSSSSKTGSVTHGDNLVRWRQRIRRNQSATTSLTGTRYYPPEFTGSLVVFCGPKTGTIRGYRNEYDYPVCYGPHYAYPSITSLSANDFAEAKATALARYLSRAIEQQRSIMGGVALGELRETLQLIRNPAKALRSRINQWDTKAKKLRSSGLRARRAMSRNERKRSVTKDLADSWLEYTFGWRPLLADIDDATKALNKRNSWMSEPVSISGSADSAKENAHLVSDQSLDYSYVKHERFTVDTFECRFHGKTKAYVVNPLRFNARLWGFDPRDFVPTLWELMPYSFLIDYFTNIGDVLQAWSWGRAGIAWTEYGYAVTRRYSVNSKPRPQSATYVDRGCSPGGYVLPAGYVSRSAHGNLIPEIVWKVPGMDSLRWLNIGALIAGRRSDRRFRL